MVAVWIAVIAGVLSARVRSDGPRWLTDARRAPIAAATISLVLCGASAWWLSPILPEGDAPHYLILAQSLIKDGDVRIENNHRRGDYLEYSLNAAAPDYLRRGVNGEIYSIHAPGLPALITPAMWLFGYPGVVVLLACIAALSTALVWHVGYGVTGSTAAAWFGWACCAVTTPFFYQATQVFPDGFAATCALVGTLPLVLGKDAPGTRPDERDARVSDARLWLLSGVSLAILPWLQTRLAILAIATAACLCLRLRNARQLLAFVSVPFVSAAAWFGYFVVVYGTPDPTAAYGSHTQTSVANLVRGFPGLLFDQQFGLIPNAPIYGFIFAGILAGLVKLRRWSWEMLALVVPYMATVGMYQMWWGGTSVPARLLAPIALILGVAAARIWHQVRTEGTKAVGLLALVASALITLVLLGPDRGRLLFNFRDGVSLWLEWANDSLDLPKGLPSLFRDDATRLWLKALIWTATLLTMWLALQVIGRQSNDPRRETSGVPLSWQSTWCLAAALMIAFTFAWQVDGAPPPTPETSEIGLLQRASPLRSLAYDFRASRFEMAQVLLSGVRIRSDRQRRPVRAPTLLAARDVPAGTYQFRVASHEQPEGTLAARVGATSLPLLTAATSIAEKRPEDLLIRLPVSVRSLVIEGDPAATRSVSSVELEPVDRSDASHSVAATESAHRAARYESADTFFLDENAYPERSGFWVAGGRTARLAIASPGESLNLFVRNAPVDNRVTIDVDGETHELTLGAREERIVTVPKPKRRPSVLVRITSRDGFRPSEAEPGITDRRYLGCWIENR